MSHRINIVIKEKGRSKIFYRGNTAAHHVTNILGLGDLKFREFIKEKTSRIYFLYDYGWGEGGIFIDYDSKYIIFYSSEEVLSFGERDFAIEHLKNNLAKLEY